MVKLTQIPLIRIKGCKRRNESFGLVVVVSLATVHC